MGGFGGGGDAGGGGGGAGGPHFGHTHAVIENPRPAKSSQTESAAAPPPRPVTCSALSMSSCLTVLFTLSTAVKL
eukprot:CAMPEP_0206133672 /NCGR_PEP_ID=MMETSP1472-20131121/54375_1 /ASSEMBLY_ACC=CAM_ASM_001108 /TAXON_ID=41880 /ORGANISM="Pycnococcus provasolii, Strain RCC251" /LENGTH=74 /DNA_ID=CAMNT_0053525249 /DNA_START=116 /DNA_END=340 /DNA_ORIENTATION=-